MYIIEYKHKDTQNIYKTRVADEDLARTVRLIFFSPEREYITAYPYVGYAKTHWTIYQSININEGARFLEKFVGTLEEMEERINYLTKIYRGAITGEKDN